MEGVGAEVLRGLLTRFEGTSPLLAAASLASFADLSSVLSSFFSSVSSVLSASLLVALLVRRRAGLRGDLAALAAADDVDDDEDELATTGTGAGTFGEGARAVGGVAAALVGFVAFASTCADNKITLFQKTNRQKIIISFSLYYRQQKVFSKLADDSDALARAHQCQMLQRKRNK